MSANADVVFDFRVFSETCQNMASDHHGDVVKVLLEACKQVSTGATSQAARNAFPGHCLPDCQRAHCQDDA